MQHFNHRPDYRAFPAKTAFPASTPSIGKIHRSKDALIVLWAPQEHLDKPGSTDNAESVDRRAIPVDQDAIVCPACRVTKVLRAKKGWSDSRAHPDKKATTRRSKLDGRARADRPANSTRKER
ncbi:hypothetical protein niasHS_016579 [Heterodera schachtii]|uniref:Uncharacterized protein n=1 Tax=Heterodera schachtii TaxID=97005 RepID=A0ABD2HV18_HETSC